MKQAVQTMSPEDLQESGGGVEEKKREKRGMRKTVATLTLPVNPDPGPLCVLSARLSGRFVRPPCSMATPLTDTLYIL